MKNRKLIRRQVRKIRIKSKIRSGTVGTRISVYRSNKNIYVQLIDDAKGKTLVSVSNKDFKDKKLPKTKTSFELGKLFAEKAKKLKIGKLIFDRGGFRYHGRIKALADGAREGGLNF
jgi:large subunit ribosomal protein L18